MNPGWGERVGVWMCAGVVVAQVVEQTFESFYQAMAKQKTSIVELFTKAHGATMTTPLAREFVEDTMPTKFGPDSADAAKELWTTFLKSAKCKNFLKAVPEFLDARKIWNDKVSSIASVFSERTPAANKFADLWQDGKLKDACEDFMHLSLLNVMLRPLRANEQRGTFAAQLHRNMNTWNMNLCPKGTLALQTMQSTNTGTA